MRAKQDLAAGTIVVAFAGAVLVGLSRIPTAKYQAIGADLFPRVCAYALIACGVGLLIRGFVRSGATLTMPRWRDVALIVLAVVAFGLAAPRVGYAIAGLLTVVISGFATREVKPRQLVIFAVLLIAFSIVLFSFILKVPMPAILLPGFRL